MRMFRLFVVLLSALAMVLTVDASSSLAATKKPHHAAAKKAAAKKAAHKAAAKKVLDHYAVPGGVRFNEPYGRGGHSVSGIRRHIIRTINSTAKGDHISIASWNIRGKGYADALIKAHRRGVSVKIVMDHGNASKAAPNPDVNRMIKAFKGDESRPAANRSSLIRCYGSCRGPHGIAHSKFFLFDHVGSRHYITMYGSNNATDVAANSQWNDLYTAVNSPNIYQAFLTIFNQMRAAKNLKQRAYARTTLGARTFDFYPYIGPAATGDPDLKRLRQVACTGAVGAGIHGHTKVRIAQDALLGTRGLKIARRLVQMRKQGCDIRFIYSLLGRQIKKILKNGHVPLLQYSYDRNRDGMYDIYLHMKTMAISGVFRGNRSAHFVLNGTANWSGTALASDEVVGEINNAHTASKYINWIDYLWHHRPARWGSQNLAVVSGGADRPIVGPNGRITMRQAPAPDPYAVMKRDGL